MHIPSLILICLAQLSLAVRVYLHPPLFSELSETLAARVSPTQARLLVSQHLGLDSFDSVNDVQWDGLETLLKPRPFVGEGARNAMVVTMDDGVARDVIPPSLKPSFSLRNPSSMKTQMSLAVSSFLHRAEQIYSSTIASTSEHPSPIVPGLLDIFHLTPSSATEKFLSEASSLVTFVESDESGFFGAFEITSLADLAAEFGKQSEQYKEAAELMRGLLSSAMTNPKIDFALMVYPSSSSSSMLRKRQAAQPPSQSPFPLPSPSPQQPIGSVSTCFTSLDACNNATNSCSERGSCIEATKARRTCFVCACETTLDDKGRKQVWVGDACEKRDVSGPFVLITGTVIVMILLVAGSLALISSIGDQELPSTLTSTVVGGHLKRD